MRLSEEEAWNLEIKLISMIGRTSINTGPLTNITLGGGGRSKPHSKSTKDKMRVSHANRTPEEKAETRLKLKAAHSARSPKQLKTTGKKRSDSLKNIWANKTLEERITFSETMSKAIEKHYETIPQQELDRRAKAHSEKLRSRSTKAKNATRKKKLAIEGNKAVEEKELTRKKQAASATARFNRMTSGDKLLHSERLKEGNASSPIKQKQKRVAEKKKKEKLKELKRTEKHRKLTKKENCSTGQQRRYAAMTLKDREEMSEARIAVAARRSDTDKSRTSEKLKAVHEARTPKEKQAIREKRSASLKIAWAKRKRSS